MVGIELYIVLSHIHNRHWQKRGAFISTDGRLLSSSRVVERQTHDDLSGHDPSCDPADLMVGVVDVQIEGIDIIYSSEQDAEAIQDEE